LGGDGVDGQAAAKQGLCECKFEEKELSVNWLSLPEFDLD